MRESVNELDLPLVVVVDFICIREHPDPGSFFYSPLWGGEMREPVNELDLYPS